MGMNILSWIQENTVMPEENTSNEVSARVEALIKMGWYDSIVSTKDSGVFIHVKWLTRNTFLWYVDTIFNNNYFFEWLNYDLFSQLIFNPSDIQWETSEVRLCDKISFISPQRASKYHKPMIFWKNKEQAEYTFSAIYDETVDETGKTLETRVLLNRDEFIARMRTYWIKYGLQIKFIEDAILSNKDAKIIIAEMIPPVPGEDAYIQTLLPLGQDLQIQMTNGKLDWKNYARVFPQVPAGKKLYEKIPLKEWKIGINIVGEKLFPPPPNDVDIFKLCSEGVVYLKENNREYIVSSQSGYVQPLIWNYDSKQYWEKQWKKVKVSIEQILQPVAVTRQIELWNIWPKTGNIHATGDICITRWITHDYWVKAENTQCIWDVSGSIYAKKDIQITGNIIGGTSHYSSIKNETSWENGQVFSENGNVFIQGKVFSHSLIHAQKWNLTATFWESSVFIWDNIVLQSAHSCIIIGKNIQIDNVVNSIIICVGRIFIKSLISHKEAGNIIFIIKPKDFKKEVEKMSLQITKLKQNTQEILQVIQQLEHRNKEIQSDPKALEIIALRKKKELTLSEKNTLVQNMQRFTSQVRELQNNNTNLSLLADKVKKQAEELEKLSEVFEKISHIQEKTLTPELRILLHQSKTKLAYLQIPDFEDFSSLSKEVLSQLADYRDIIQNNTFPTELIQELQEGSDINWQHQ